MSETYYPGWKVYIDGNEGAIYRANYAFRAVPLNPGNHRVVFVYKPSSVILGGVITLVGIVATVLMLVGSTWIAALPAYTFLASSLSALFSPTAIIDCPGQGRIGSKSFQNHTKLS